MELSNICEYSSKRIDSSLLTVENYVSTENMMQNKGGITLAAKVPVENSVEFLPGDILISNIRPYFRKIWLSDKKGGCSSDVLCIRALPGTDSTYLYYLLSQDSFFDYVMSGAKGCKMPRGDKSQIMQWDVALPNFEAQHRIASILKSIDDKIQLNNRINHNLELQAQALYKSWFVDFEPFKGGKFVESELGMIPEGWSCVSLTDISMIFDSKREPLSGMQRENMKKIYPYYGATEIMDYVENYIFDGIYLLIGEDGSVVRPNGAPFLQYVEGKFWPNNHAHVLQGTNGYSTEMLHCALLGKNIMHAVTGAVQAKLSQSNMRKILFVLPPKDVSNAFDSFIQSIYKSKRTIERENNILSNLRDIILPKLMSGELKISDLTC